ncbi:MAG: efflux RND transporter periplasmic adaptor subunit [Pseudomonadota bacterium]
MKRSKIIWISALLIFAGGAVFLWYHTRPEPLKVVVKPVDMGIVERTVANTRVGTLKACRRAKLSPSMGGQIARLPIKEGDRVKRGQLLLELWNEDAVAESNLVKSESESADASSKAVCLKADMAEREAGRLARLRKTGAVSEEKMDQTATGAKALKADCEAARASALMSKSRVDVAKANLDKTRLIAPFDGVIAEINGEVNEYITPSPIGVATPPAVDLIDDACFYVIAPIDEVDAPAIVLGMPVRIGLDAFSGRHFEGHVRRIAPYILDVEKQSRTLDVEVEFARHDDIQGLLAGYSADVEIVLDSKIDTLRVPTEAILDGDRVFVFLPASQTLKERTIKKGISNWNFTEVVSGLTKGDMVVVNVDQPGIKDDVSAMLMAEDQLQ